MILILTTKKRCFVPICEVLCNTDRENHRMYTIDRIPRAVNSFFRPHRPHFSKPAWSHFTLLVSVMAMAAEHGLKQLNSLLRGHTHRTKDGEFLWQSNWDECAVLRDIALDTLRRLYRKGEPLYFILDDTHIPKRGKKMQGVGKFYLHSQKRCGEAHCVLKASLLYRGVTIPWGNWLYLKDDDAEALALPFETLTALAARAIREAGVLDRAYRPVTVLFDSYYLCKTVVDAVAQRRWHYIGVVKKNRRFFCHGAWHKVSTYGGNVLKRHGKKAKLPGRSGYRAYRLAERVGRLKSLGESEVKLVFSARRDGHRIALATNDVRRSARKVVADFSKRWSIEMLIKDEKQQLGMGAYRVWRYQAVVRYLHLVDCAYACLTRLGMDALRAQGQKKDQDKELRLPTIRHLQADLREKVWNQLITEVVKHSHERPVIRRLEKLLAA